MGLKELDGVEREYLELEYAEGDRLFVPVEFLDRVQKYLGGGEGEPPLNRLGTGAWALMCAHKVAASLSRGKGLRPVRQR